MQHRCRWLVLFSLIGMLWPRGPGAAPAEPDDALLTTPATPAVIARGLEADGYQLGIAAYTWGYPLVRMERVVRAYSEVASSMPATSYRAPVNRIGWARELATPAAKD